MDCSWTEVVSDEFGMNGQSTTGCMKTLSIFAPWKEKKSILQETNNVSKRRRDEAERNVLAWLQSVGSVRWRVRHDPPAHEAHRWTDGQRGKSTIYTRMWDRCSSKSRADENTFDLDEPQACSSSQVLDCFGRVPRRNDSDPSSAASAVRAVRPSRSCL
mmetsp:Transcript_5319/g.33381  ORF Transcript_5319/g.33381 Transcript_5319/m.33381 type:complete len:159 (-) Transcript_5319:156-632(-)